MTDAFDNPALAARFVTRTPPGFADPHAHRDDCRSQLVRACKVSARLGLSEGLLGHLTGRDPVDAHTLARALGNPQTAWISFEVLSEHFDLR